MALSYRWKLRKEVTFKGAAGVKEHNKGEEKVRVW
jgi:hypothetical protein